MTEGVLLDIAHIGFLDMIKEMINMGGTASAKGVMIRNALKAAEQVTEVDYSTFDDFLEAIEKASNPITIVEGKATHQGNFVFGLKNCPFGPSIRTYIYVFDSLPESYGDFTKEFNKPSMITDKYRVGEGAGVSPFCALHQPMRSAIAERLTIGGKKIKIYQLGCKSGSGQKGFADKWISAVGVDKGVVDKVLDDNMCCYYLQIQD